VIRRLAAVAAALVAGCASHATEAIVTVSNADLTVPGDFDTIRIEVHEMDAAGRVLSSADVKPCAPGEHGDGCKTFPFTVLFVPGDRIDTRAWVSLRALSAGATVIDDAFVLAFVRDSTLRYDLVLYRTCKQSRCADEGHVCNAQGSCAPLGAPELTTDAGAVDAATTADAGGDGATAPTDAAAGTDGPPPPRRVFLTKETTFGNFGGLAGGNTICAREAMMAGLAGTFVAILGSSARSPKSYLVLDGGARPIVRPDGQQVATDATFWEASHMKPIDVGPDGVAIGPSGNLSQNAWTGFDYTGATVAGGTCVDWTSVTLGYIGDPHGVAPASIVGAWANYAAQGNCTSNYPCHLYCIEQ
jgi:hypothetical protein